MKSIMQDKTSKQCYLCAKLDKDYTPKNILEEHHIFEGSANRKLSEKYGLKVYLCQAHHNGDCFGSRKAVHRPDLNNYSKYLHEEGEKAFITDFMQKTLCNKFQAEAIFQGIFGKRYINVEEWKP